MKLFVRKGNANNSGSLFQADLQKDRNYTVISFSKVDPISLANVNGNLHPGENTLLSQQDSHSALKGKTNCATGPNT